MASASSQRDPTPLPSEEGEGNLRSKRSAITIECSDGSKLIFLRPHRRRSGSYAATSPSTSPPYSPSPPPSPESGSGATSGPSPGNNQGYSPGHKKGSDSGDNKKGKRLVSMSNVHDSDVRSVASHTSLPTYLSGRCTECGYIRGHSDICALGNRLFISALRSSEERPSVSMPVQGGAEIHDNDTEHQQDQHGNSPNDQGGRHTRTPQPQPVEVVRSRPTTGTTPRSSSSMPSETRRRGTRGQERRTTSRSSTHSRHISSQNSRTPSSLKGTVSQHDHKPSLHRLPSHNHNPSPHASDHDSNISSKARYSIEAVIGRVSPSSRSRSRYRGDKFILEVRELSPHSPTHSPHYFDANIRGGGEYQAGAGSSNRDNAGGTGRSRSRSRSRDILLRGLRRCSFAFSWLCGGDSESNGSSSSSSRRRDAYDRYARHDGRAQSRFHSRRTRRH